MIRALSEFLAPRYCAQCGAAGGFICTDCAPFLRLVGASRCGVCGRPFPDCGGAVGASLLTHPCADCLRERPFYDAHRSLLIFDELAQKLVHALKYAAEFWVGRFYRERLPGLTGEFKAVDVIVPVPLHADRLRERGYNQSLVLARSWRVILNRPVAHDALVRVKNTVSQTGLARAERRRNLQDAFVARVPANVRGRNVLLVDDVHTTGATLSAAAKALKTAGAVGVSAATLAVVPLDNGAART